MRHSAVNQRFLILLAVLSLAAFFPRAVLWAENFNDPTQATKVLQVAAAADLKYALDEMIQEFHRLHPGISVQVSYGSSGNFYATLLNRAPFDVYLSADLLYPQKLLDDGLALSGSKFLYGSGRLALWAPKNSHFDLNALGLAVVRGPAVRHIAIANPRHAPYGRAAEAALRSAGLYDAVKAKLVFGENVGQAFQFVESGACDVGIIALSLALAPGARQQGQYLEIAPKSYPAIQQGGVILKWTKEPEAAWDLRALVLSPRGRAILGRFGFQQPGE